MKTWHKFPNGKVWRVDETGHIAGSVHVPTLLGDDEGGWSDAETQLDDISEAVTGSLDGLTSFKFQFRGNNVVTFAGSVADMLADEDGKTTALADHSLELCKALMAQYGLTEQECEHARLALDTDYGEECVLGVIGTGRELRCPPYPQECDYVRVVIDGLEVAYWTDDEWSEAPAEVMGAIIGAARGRQ